MCAVVVTLQKACSQMYGHIKSLFTTMNAICSVALNDCKACLQMHGRTKSLFSTMKKLLRLGNMSAGGRTRDQVYDLLGLRCVVQPRADLPPDEAELLATKVGGT